MHPLLFDLGTFELGSLSIPLRVTSYGTALVVAMLVGWLVTSRLGRQLAPRDTWFDLTFGAVIGGLVGAKLLELGVRFPDLLAGRTSFGRLMSAGGVWLGGVIGGLLFIVFLTRRKKLDLHDVLAVLFAALPLSHAIGRIGCLLAGCCHGKACELPWAIVYSNPLAQQFAGTPLGVPLHPSPLYEALAELLNFAVLLVLLRRSKMRWIVPAAWMGLYGVERFLLEFLRGDDRGSWLGLISTSQGLALVLVGVSVSLLMLGRTKSSERP